MLNNIINAILTIGTATFLGLLALGTIQLALEKETDYEDVEDEESERKISFLQAREEFLQDLNN